MEINFVYFIQIDISTMLERLIQSLISDAFKFANNFSIVGWKFRILSVDFVFTLSYQFTSNYFLLLLLMLLKSYETVSFILWRKFPEILAFVSHETIKIHRSLYTQMVIFQNMTDKTNIFMFLFHGSIDWENIFIQN